MALAIGRPQPGHAGASEETSRPQSGQLTSAIDPSIRARCNSGPSHIVGLSRRQPRTRTGQAVDLHLLGLVRDAESVGAAATAGVRPQHMRFGLEVGMGLRPVGRGGFFSLGSWGPSLAPRHLG